MLERMSLHLGLVALLGLGGCTPAAQPAAAPIEPVVTERADAGPKLEPLDHIEREHGFRVRLPPGCELRSSVTQLELADASFEALGFDCAHDSGELRLWLVDSDALAGLGTDDMLAFITALPEPRTSVPLRYPLDPHPTYFGSTYEQHPRRARWWKASAGVHMFGEMSTTRDDGGENLVVHSLRPLDRDEAPSWRWTEGPSAEVVDASLARIAEDFEFVLAEAPEKDGIFGALEPSTRRVLLERDGEFMADLRSFFAAHPDDFELMLAVFRGLFLSAPADDGRSFDEEFGMVKGFENHRIDDLGELGEIGWVWFTAGPQSWRNYVWTRCGHVLHLRAAGKLDVRSADRLVHAIDDEVAARWCPR